MIKGDEKTSVGTTQANLCRKPAGGLFPFPITSTPPKSHSSYKSELVLTSMYEPTTPLAVDIKCSSI